MLSDTFGSKLRRMRAARGLTTKRLAELAGVPPSYLTQIQKGNREPPDDLVARLARVLALGSHEASELRRVLKKERILRAINKSGAETAAAHPRRRNSGDRRRRVRRVRVRSTANNLLVVLSVDPQLRRSALAVASDLR